MLRILISVLFSIAYGADHNVFKNCSRVPFCSNLRDQTLDQSAQFTANTSAFRINNNVLTIPLHNSNNEELVLQVYLMKGSTARVKVLEKNHSRYELSDILVSEPEVARLNSIIVKKGYITFGTGADPEQYKFTVNDGPPFQRDLKVVLRGDRLVMQNTNDSKAFSFDVDFPQATQLYGLLHHAYKIGLRDTVNGKSDPFRLRNSDTANYETDSPMALYGSVPVIYGNTGSALFGIFLHNAAEQWVDISYANTPSAYFMVESGTLDFFVMLGPGPTEVIRQFTSLTGVAHMPQLWTLGYHQCRFTYTSQEEVKDVVAQMDNHDFPMDAVWLDDGHSNGNRYFEWNPENFSDPVEMQKYISATGRKIVTIIDPHIKVDSNYSVYAEAKEKYFIKWTNGSNFEGICWPGLSSWIDFLDPAASDYYASWYAYDKFNGSTETLAGIWNDMNEPSVFDENFENTMPFETVHYGGVSHRDIHNIYGFLHTKSTHQGLMQRDEGTKRPFILTRSHFAGSQRYAAMWTGDNTADWPYLAASYSECMTANILGMAAAWLPFFRGHSNKGTARREPYLFDEDVQAVIRNAIKLRYKHIPVFYTLFYEHTLYGDPVVRPLFYTFPSYLEYDDHMLVGTDIMVRPILEPNVTEVLVTIPSNHKVEYWYRVDDDSWNWHTGPTEIDDLKVNISTIPIFYRGGSIIARKDREKVSTAHMINDPFNLYVNLDSVRLAEGRLYVDDYTSFEYSKSKNYLYLGFSYLQDSNGVQITNLDPTSNSTDVTVLIQSIIVHSTSSSGSRTSIRKEHTTTSDGTPLVSIDIANELRKRSAEGVTLYL
ncbi:hypothetical protein NQ318_016206 [Aromia moschata]|uniref:Glucosidase II subunit alpha n=1 Tax=Aromia moschata TaxID=1265417 RepID=A0AAV8YE22_9CUCU|nr:hypothetical protein NQ318_016206 [Aromia moschata]